MSEKTVAPPPRRTPPPQVQEGSEAAKAAVAQKVAEAFSGSPPISGKTGAVSAEGVRTRATAANKDKPATPPATNGAPPARATREPAAETLADHQEADTHTAKLTLEKFQEGLTSVTKTLTKFLEGRLEKTEAQVTACKDVIIQTVEEAVREGGDALEALRSVMDGTVASPSAPASVEVEATHPVLTRMVLAALPEGSAWLDEWSEEISAKTKSGPALTPAEPEEVASIARKYGAVRVFEGDGEAVSATYWETKK